MKATIERYKKANSDTSNSGTVAEVNAQVKSCQSFQSNNFLNWLPGYVWVVSSEPMICMAASVWSTFHRALRERKKKLKSLSPALSMIFRQEFLSIEVQTSLKQCTTHSQHQLFGPVDHTRIVFWTDAPQFYVRNARGIGIENLSPKKLNLCTLAEMKLYKKPCQCHNFSDHSWFKHSWFRIHRVISLIHRMKGQNVKY